ncbi:hypothetical protein [Pseudomonas farris]
MATSFLLEGHFDGAVMMLRVRLFGRADRAGCHGFEDQGGLKIQPLKDWITLAARV